MAEYTKIVEFYGLPGCGKTTICSLLRKHFENKGYRVGLLNEVTKICSVYHLVSVISYKDIALLFKWCYSIMNDSHTSFKIARAPYKRQLIYRCIKMYSDYDYVFIEHGVVQSIVSALYGTKDYTSFLNKMICNKLLQSSSVDMFIYCHVAVEEAFKRIRIRNRKSSGRFDQKPDNMLSYVLEQQSGQFDKLTGIIKDVGLDVECFNGDSRIDICVENTLNILSRLKE